MNSVNNDRESSNIVNHYHQCRPVEKKEMKIYAAMLLQLIKIQKSDILSCF